MKILDSYIDCLVQDCSNSSGLAMELLQSCTKPSIWCSPAVSPLIHSILTYIFQLYLYTLKSSSVKSIKDNVVFSCHMLSLRMTLWQSPNIMLSYFIICYLCLLSLLPQCTGYPQGGSCSHTRWSAWSLTLPGSWGMNIHIWLWPNALVSPAVTLT